MMPALHETFVDAKGVGYKVTALGRFEDTLQPAAITELVKPPETGQQMWIWPVSAFEGGGVPLVPGRYACGKPILYPSPNLRFMHYKGGRYETIGTGRLAQDDLLSWMVVYRSLGAPTSPETTWVRALHHFLALVPDPKDPTGKKMIYRFEREVSYELKRDGP
jgi:hypothetical protein